MANIQHLGFITYKIMPFIIIAYLVISSLLSGTTKGFHLLAGIMITNVIVIMVSRIPQIKDSLISTDDYLTKMKECNLINMDVGTPLSYLPLSTSIISFIFSYFIHIIRVNKVAGKNVGLIMMLLILFLYDIYYQSTNCGSSRYFIMVPLFIGVFMGIIWASSTSEENLMGVAGTKQSETCATTDSGTYQCKMQDGTETIAF